MPENEQWEQWWKMAAEEGHDHRAATAFTYERIFAGIPLKGRSVLEIGSGRGLTAFYVALSGAQHVVSMEPQLHGARSTVIETQQQRLKQLKLENFEVLTEDFNTWDPGGRSFDLVLSFASINHLHESPHHAAYHEETFATYVSIAKKIRGILNPGGTAVISDGCRYGFFWFAKYVGIRPPWSRKRVTINWRIHQNPGTWTAIFREANFSRIQTIYPLPYRLRGLGRAVANPWANFFLLSSFTLRCQTDQGSDL